MQAHPATQPTPGAGLWAQARAFFALAGPMVISRLGLAAMGMADGVMLAWRDTQQLAFHGLADALAGRAFEVGMAFVMAGMALAAQARSAGPAAQRQVGRVWRLALLLALGAGSLGAVLGLLGTPLLRLAGQAPALANGAGPVVAILCLGMLPAMVAIATAGLLEAIGKPAMVAVAVVLANGLNIGLNWLLIDGVLGGPPLGAVGVAWSTTLVRVLLAVALLAYAWRLPQQMAYGLRQRFSRQDWQAGAAQRQRGWSAAGSVAVLGGLSLGLPVMAGWLGEQALAEITALFLVLAPCMVVAWGLSDAAGLRVASVLGATGGGGQLRRTGLQQAGLALGLLLVLAATWLLLPAALLHSITPDTTLAASVLLLLPLGLATVLGDGLSFVCVNALRSLGVLRAPFWLQLGCGLLMLALAWALAFGLGWGLRGLLAGHALAAGLRAVALAALYHRCAGRLDRLATTTPAPAAPLAHWIPASP